MDIINLTLVAILIALTGFFVATEFAMVKVRMTRINQLIEEGKPGAIAAKKVVTHLDEYLSACQLGITITALGLGALAEPTVERLLHPVFDSMNLDPTWSSVLSYVIAFTSVTFLHVVVGELAPKTVAIQKAEAITLLFAKPIIWFYRIMFPAIWILNGAAGLLVKVFGLKQASEHEVSHSEEELRMILSESYKSGEINQTELTYVNNIFEFDNRIAKEIMVPRTSIIAVSIDDTLGDTLDLMDAEKYTRYPVVDGDKDHILGIINVKDMMKAQRKYESTDRPMRELMKPVISIIETIPINELLLKMQKERTHMAVLYDEYGGTSGIVTVEDILEEIVGEIQDEYDTDEVEDIRQINENHFLLSSMVLIEDVNDLLGIHLSEEEVDTIGGWILTKKYEVKIGDVIEEEGFAFMIKEMDGHQILFIEVKKV
ncbi:hemolysin family protein [Bacillus sp. JJ722]|uniref:hemolysin family protein n=1 Tax=Bacillus sp. JJ722 TaxID=3122973 RepID=UPI002FFE0712